MLKDGSLFFYVRGINSDYLISVSFSLCLLLLLNANLSLSQVDVAKLFATSGKVSGSSYLKEEPMNQDYQGRTLTSLEEAGSVFL